MNPFEMQASLARAWFEAWETGTRAMTAAAFAVSHDAMRSYGKWFEAPRLASSLFPPTFPWTWTAPVGFGGESPAAWLLPYPWAFPNGPAGLANMWLQSLARTDATGWLSAWPASANWLRHSTMSFPWLPTREPARAFDDAVAAAYRSTSGYAVAAVTMALSNPTSMTRLGPLWPTTMWLTTPRRS